MKIYCDISHAWQYALLQKNKGIDEERILKDIEGSINYSLESLYKSMTSVISDGQNHIIKLVKEYWAEDKMYFCANETGCRFKIQDSKEFDIEWLKSLNPYDVYFMIDEDGQLEEARNLLFPKDSFSMSVLKHDYKDSKITEETYHRNCATCLYYEGSRKCPGHAPCSYWGKGTMFNDYCSRWEENIFKRSCKEDE